MRDRRQLLVFSALLALVGCAGGRVEAPLVTSSTATDLTSQSKAVIVASSSVETSALWTSRWPVKLTFMQKGPDGKDLIESLFVVEGTGKPETPHVQEVKAGRYDLITFSYTLGNARYTNTAGMMGLHLTSFLVKPGDVVYLGHLLIKNEPSIVAQSKPKFTLSVLDHSTEARAAVTKVAAAMAPMMTTSLMPVPALLAAR
jgi:hypothetical protein